MRSEDGPQSKYLRQLQSQSHADGRDSAISFQADSKYFTSTEAPKVHFSDDKGADLPSYDRSAD